MIIKKIGKLLLFFVFALLLATPSSVDARGNRNITYRSTVVGSGVERFPHDYNRIKSAKNDFNVNEDVYVMTRVFNINEVNNFRVKHRLYRSGQYQKDFYSNDYSPRKNWWAETYAWNNLGNLASGDYEVKTYISVDNEPYKYYRNANFQVAGSSDYSYQQVNYNNNYSNNYNYNNNNQSYNYLKTHTGTGIRDLGNWKFEVTNPKTTFYENENLNVLGQLDRISGVDRFKLKYDLYKGNSHYKTLYSWEQKPYGKYWAYNYTHVNFGKLSVGDYTLKTSININGGSYREVNSKSISVRSSYNRVNNDYSYHPDYNNYPVNYINYNNDNIYNYNNNGRNYYDEGSYTYRSMTTGTGLSKTTSDKCGNNYKVQSVKTVFYPNEDVFVSTAFDLKNVTSAEVKHDLYINNTSRVSKSKIINLSCNYGYTSARKSVYSNLGKIVTGNHQIKSYIRLDGGAWHYMGSKNIRVLDYSSNFDFEWTKSGTSNASTGWYRSLPSLSTKTVFNEGDRLAVVTKLDGIENLRSYRIKHDLLRYNSIVRTIESPIVYDGDTNYEYYLSDFAYLYPGDYVVKTYVSVNGSSYRLLSTKNLNFRGNYYGYY